MRAQQGSFVLKHQNRRRKQSVFENPDFADALYGGEDPTARYGAGEPMRVRVRELGEPSVAGEKDVVVGSRRFDGLVIIDGVISSGEAMAALAPSRIASVEVIKGDGAAKEYPNEPDAKPSGGLAGPAS